MHRSIFPGLIQAEGQRVLESVNLIVGGAPTGMNGVIYIPTRDRWSLPQHRVTHDHGSPVILSIQIYSDYY